MVQTTTQDFEVSDYVEACALRAAKVPLADLIVRNERVVFLFDDADGKATAALQAHRRGSLKISSQAFAESLHTLKTLMFGKRREAGLR